MVTSMRQLVGCETCLGYGDKDAGTRFAQHCGTCDGTGWADGEPHLCPHCETNVKPAEPHILYGRDVWHRECIKEAMKDPNAADVVIARDLIRHVKEQIERVRDRLDVSKDALRTNVGPDSREVLAASLTASAIALDSCDRTFGEVLKRLCPED